MTLAPPDSRPSPKLAGRSAERRSLDELLDIVRAGQSQSLVLHGEPGIGKSALLDYLAGRAGDFQVLRVAGVQSEMELAFAGLHQLCAPLLSQLDILPGPQAEALRTAFGIGSGPPPDRFLIGLAVLGLLSEASGERPVLCVIDDARWLDRASSQALGFVARRLGSESVGIVFATRVAGRDLAQLAEIEVKGLTESDARALLDAVLLGPIDRQVRDQIVAETRGNPLALLELPRGLNAAELAGGFGLPGAVSLTSRIEDSFRRQINGLPPQTRRLLQLAAADPTGDPALLARAADQLGITTDAAGPAVDRGLAVFGSRVRFRHPLARLAAYRTATNTDKREIHRALAAATDPLVDPDRRAWHRAQAAAGPDEDVAAELERSAGRAQARGGLAAAAAFAERAAGLTPGLTSRANRTLAAAQAALSAGAFAKALELLATSEAASLDELQTARVDWLRGQIAFASGQGNDAAPLLLKAARRFEAIDEHLARETYLDAYQAAQIASQLADDGDLEEVSRAARNLPPPADPPRPAALLLDGLARLVTDGPATAATSLRLATTALAGPEISGTEGPRWGWIAPVVAAALWDDQGYRLVERPIQLARQLGALDRLPMLLNQLAAGAVWRGDFGPAASLIADADAVCEATGARIPPYA
ncbi:MAG: AAA family ATPase, partial [Mycobacteriales bacterium]